MKKADNPEIALVDRIDNSAVITFKDGAEAVFPATLLHAAIGVADAMRGKTLRKEPSKQNLE